MNWIQHFLIATLLGAIIVTSFHLSPWLILFSAAGGLAPDIDHDSSKIRKILNVSVPILALFMAASLFGLTEKALIYALAFVGVYHIILTFFKPKHRGITHSLAFALFLSLIVAFLFSQEGGMMFFLGYLSHLAADGCLKIL